MKFFKKYYLVLPPVALLYGIYILNIKIPKEGIPQNPMDSLVNGWVYIGILFAALAAGIIYQLQQNKKQQYIYSLPWTKKEIYQKSMRGLHISFLIAEIIYAVCFARKVMIMQASENINRVLLCTLLNVAFWFAVCMITELSLVATAYVWQGLIITIAAIYMIIPMIIQNIVFLIQMVFKIQLPYLLNWIIYNQVLENNFLYPIKYYMEYNSFQAEEEKMMLAQYGSVSCICIIVLLLAGLFCLWYAKRQYTRSDQALNRMLTRLTELENRVILTMVIGIWCFNSISNMEIFKKYMMYRSTLGRRIYALLMWNKNVMAITDNSKKIIQGFQGIHFLIYFLISFVAVYLVITLFQTIRRKHYERAC